MLYTLFLSTLKQIDWETNKWDQISVKPRNPWVVNYNMQNIFTSLTKKNAWCTVIFMTCFSISAKLLLCYNSKTSLIILRYRVEHATFWLEVQFPLKGQGSLDKSSKNFKYSVHLSMSIKETIVFSA